MSLLVFSLLPIALIVLSIGHGPELNNWLPRWGLRALDLATLSAYPVGVFLLWEAVKTPAQAGIVAALVSFTGLFFLLHLAIVTLFMMGAVPHAV